MVALRATLEIKPDGRLVYAQDQLPLNLRDYYYGELNQSSVQYENDLAPFKPLCDVVVNGSAYCPGGKPVRYFNAGVRIMPGADKPGQPILSKQLMITGPRVWKKGLITGFDLEKPHLIDQLPIRYEHAYGGESIIELNDPVASRVPQKHRLSPEQRKGHPRGEKDAPAAHTACEQNPLGKGYVEPWYIKAKKLKSLPAPQILDPQVPLKWNRAYPVQGFGFIGRAWLPRQKLCGTYNDKWLKERHPNLPEDFDFKYWNGAHPDMQISYLEGGEQIELLNLTPKGKLVLKLPGDIPYMLVRCHSGQIGQARANLDTLVIEPDENRIYATFRATVMRELDVRLLEARLIVKNKDQEKTNSALEVTHG